MKNILVDLKHIEKRLNYNFRLGWKAMKYTIYTMNILWPKNPFTPWGKHKNTFYPFLDSKLVFDIENIVFNDNIHSISWHSWCAIIPLFGNQSLCPRKFHRQIENHLFTSAVEITAGDRWKTVEKSKSPVRWMWYLGEITGDNFL